MTGIGVISDTHGLLRPEAVAALHGVELIVHAGDIGSPDVIDELSRLAPVRAVRGNVDKAPWAERYPFTDAFEIDGLSAYVLHELPQLDVDPAAAGFQVVISGHSHKPVAEWRDEVFYLNPGSAGPRRFKLPICLALLEVDGGRPAHRYVDLLS